MASYDKGKKEVVEFIKKTFGQGSTCLDVGACDGKWYDLVGDYLTMDAVEVWAPNVERYGLKGLYRNVFVTNIVNFWYDWYDLVIFGDILEHLSVEKAQEVLKFAKEHCSDLIVAVPFNYPQGAVGGNPFEYHLQDDLTREVFFERYGDDWEAIWEDENYAYYHRKI